MVKALLRSAISLVATACFALSALTWGRMPGCATGAGGPSPHIAYHGASHQHSDPPGKLPAGVNCLVHLCCIQLITPAAPSLTLARVGVPEQAAGLVLTTPFVPVRPSHTLPFAQAPPITPA
jgi:hypothetical protein